MKARLSRWLNKVTVGVTCVDKASNRSVQPARILYLAHPIGDPLMALAIHTCVPLSAVLPVAANIGRRAMD